ncbi:MAG: cellulase family glycosylhydrolase, partial [Bacteroidota bacterium]
MLQVRFQTNKLSYSIFQTVTLMLLFTAFSWSSCSVGDQNAFVDKPEEIETKGFFVKDGTIYDGNGRKFTLMGPNAGVFWQNNKKCHLQSLREHIPRAGANAVRLVTVTNNEDWAWNSTAANKRAMIEASIEGEIVPMLEFHDATCDDDFEPVADYWKSEKIIQLCKEFEKYLIINLANEHNFETMEDWLERYSRLIQNLRKKGINNMIVVDGHSKCGQGPE